MNKARWEALPDDLKAVFDKHCGEEWLREVAEIWRGSDDGGIAVAVEDGNEHVVLTEEEMAAFTHGAGAGGRRLDRGARRDFDAGGARRRGAGGAVGPAVLSSEAVEGGGRRRLPRRAPPSARRSAGVARWWALLGGVLTLGARGDDRR